MYWINYEPDGSRSYSLMPISVRAYYHHYTTPDTKVKTEAFPEGFRQVVGNAMNRSDDSHVSWRLERETGTRGSNEMGEWRPYFPSSNCSLTDPAPNCQDSSDVDDPTYIAGPLTFCSAVAAPRTRRTTSHTSASRSIHKPTRLGPAMACRLNALRHIPTSTPALVLIFCTTSSE